jgi:hypothetical protein
MRPFRPSSYGIRGCDPEKPARAHRGNTVVETSLAHARGAADEAIGAVKPSSNKTPTDNPTTAPTRRNLILGIVAASE